MITYISNWLRSRPTVSREFSLTNDNKQIKLFTMSMLVALQMYPTEEVCEELAKMKGRHKYARQQVHNLIKRKLPTAQKFGNRYMLTDAEIKWLATQTRVNKKRIFIDK